MKLLLVHQYFKTPDEGSGIRSWYIARALSHAGHDVTVISGHSAYEGIREMEKVKVRYFKIPYDNRFGFYKRIWAFFSFVRKSKSYIDQNPDFQHAYLLSTPLSVGYIGLYLKKKHNIPYTFEVGDLWPAAPVQLGMIRFPWLVGYLQNLEQKIYKNANRLVALSPAIRDYMEYTIDYTMQVDVVTNMSDCVFFKPGQVVLNLPDATRPFVIVYAGAFGYANHLTYLLDVAKLAISRNMPLHFHLMGDGRELQSLQMQAKVCNNVTFHSWGGKEQVRELLNQCHAVYISYLKNPILETGSPNKLFDGLAAGKMILFNGKGWIKKLIETHECGIYHDPESPGMLLDSLEPFLKSPALIEHYQENARVLAETQFEVSKQTQRVVSFFDT